MPSVQQCYGINPPTPPPRFLRLKIDVWGVDPEIVDELKGRLEELRQHLEDDHPKIEGKITVESF